MITPAKETGELVDIAYKAMATDISDRFQSVDEFQDAIRDYYSHAESIALTDRGQEHLTNALEAHNGVYEDYNKARFAFDEAIQLWPENSRARRGLVPSNASTTPARPSSVATTPWAFRYSTALIQRIQSCRRNCRRQSESQTEIVSRRWRRRLRQFHFWCWESLLVCTSINKRRTRSSI